jgi:chemotaxis protein CheX
MLSAENKISGGGLNDLLKREPMQLNNDQIRDVAPAIWQAVLNLALESRETIPKPAAKVVSSCVYITGAWNGAVALSCDIGLAAQAASIMFDLRGARPSSGDMQDALGELTNMVGGNIKALLPEPCQLSLPRTVEATDPSAQTFRSQIVTELPFRCGDFFVNLSVLQGEQAAA